MRGLADEGAFGKHRPLRHQQRMSAGETSSYSKQGKAQGAPVVRRQVGDGRLAGRGTRCPIAAEQVLSGTQLRVIATPVPLSPSAQQPSSSPGCLRDFVEKCKSQQYRSAGDPVHVLAAPTNKSCMYPSDGTAAHAVPSQGLIHGCRCSGLLLPRLTLLMRHLPTRFGSMACAGSQLLHAAYTLGMDRAPNIIVVSLTISSRQIMLSKGS